MDRVTSIHNKFVLQLVVGKEDIELTFDDTTRSNGRSHCVISRSATPRVADYALSNHYQLAVNYSTASSLASLFIVDPASGKIVVNVVVAKTDQREVYIDWRRDS